MFFTPKCFSNITKFAGKDLKIMEMQNPFIIQKLNFWFYGITITA